VIFEEYFIHGLQIVTTTPVTLCFVFGALSVFDFPLLQLLWLPQADPNSLSEILTDLLVLLFA